jgi:hypothetical protein
MEWVVSVWHSSGIIVRHEHSPLIQSTQAISALRAMAAMCNLTVVWIMLVVMNSHCVSQSLFGRGLQVESPMCHWFSSGLPRSGKCVWSQCDFIGVEEWGLDAVTLMTDLHMLESWSLSSTDVLVHLCQVCLTWKEQRNHDYPACSTCSQVESADLVWRSLEPSK